MAGYTERAFEAFVRWRRFVTHDIWYIGRPGEEIPEGFVIKQIRVLILLVKNLVEDELLLRAAALTFTTMLSIVPVLAIMLYIIQQFDLGTEIGRWLQSWSESAASAVTRSDADQQIRDVLGLVVPGVVTDPTQGTEATQTFQDPIAWLFDTAERSADPRAIGLAGLFFILTTVFGLMWNIESAFNAIWGLRATRSWFRMFSDYMMIMLLLPFLVAGVFGVTAVLESNHLAERLGPLRSYSLWALRYAVIWMAFAVLYVAVPNTKVKWRYALLAGVVAGTLWCLLSEAYFKFQVGLGRNSIIYSSFALFPLLLIWIYLSWTILLFGAELTFAYENEKTFAMERLAAGASHAYREAVGLRAMVEIARRFDTGRPGLTISEAAKAWNVPTRLLNETLDQLEQAGLVTRCAAEPPTFVPARSIDRISVGEVVSALREAGREPSALREDDAMKQILDEANGKKSDLMSANLADMLHRVYPPRQALPAQQNAPSVLGGPSTDAPESDSAQEI
jgi:membrane protein